MKKSARFPEPPWGGQPAPPGRVDLPALTSGAGTGDARPPEAEGPFADSPSGSMFFGKQQASAHPRRRAQNKRLPRERVGRVCPHRADWSFPRRRTEDKSALPGMAVFMRSGFPKGMGDSWQISGKVGHPAPQGRNPNSSGCQPGERPGSERPDPVRVEPSWESSQSVRPFQGRITVGRGFRGLHPRLFTLNPSGIAGPSSVLPALFSPTLAEPRKSAMNQTKRDGVGRRPSGVVACEARPSLAWRSRRPSSRCS